MNSLKLLAALATGALAGGLTAAQAGEQLVLEEVIVTAKAPSRPLELVVVTAELPEHRRTPAAPEATETFEASLGVEAPRLDLASSIRVELTHPALSF